MEFVESSQHSTGEEGKDKERNEEEEEQEEEMI